MTESSSSTNGGITIKHTFDAPRERVFQAWTTPEQFAQWWGPKGFSSPLSKISLDVEPGGVWTAPIVSDEDGTEVPFSGVYREVSAPERLAFTMTAPADDPDGTADVTTLVFTDLGDRTEMAFHQAGEMSEEDLAELTSGWASFFDCLNEYLTRS